MKWQLHSGTLHNALSCRLESEQGLVRCTLPDTGRAAQEQHGIVGSTGLGTLPAAQSAAQMRSASRPVTIAPTRATALAVATVPAPVGGLHSLSPALLWRAGAGVGGGGACGQAAQVGLQLGTQPASQLGVLVLAVPCVWASLRQRQRLRHCTAFNI